jgi:hypothetical protein
MATKIPTPAAEAPVATPYEEILKQPDSITLFGNVHQVLDEMIIHARNGYRLYAGVSPNLFPEGGMMSVLLQRGDPMPLVYQRAAESIASEQRKEAAEFTRRVNEEAARRIAAKVQADQDARIAAAEAVANAAVEKIKADVAAERLRIEQAQ